MYGDELRENYERIGKYVEKNAPQPEGGNWDIRKRSNEVVKVNFLSGKVCQDCFKVAARFTKIGAGHRGQCHQCKTSMKTEALKKEDREVVEFILGDKGKITGPRYVQTFAFLKDFWTDEEICNWLNEKGLQAKNVSENNDSVNVNLIDSGKIDKGSLISYRCKNGIIAFTGKLD